MGNKGVKGGRRRGGGVRGKGEESGDGQFFSPA